MILVTGADGFVGKALIKYFYNNNFKFRGVTRKPSDNLINIGDINSNTDWCETLKDIDVIIHLAAHVHVMDGKSQSNISKFEEVNVKGTINLAKQAINSGVKRFIFLSSIKVNGNFTSLNRPFKVDDKPNPSDPYSKSKLKAENELFKISQTTKMKIVVIRPPLVYGSGVKANFASLLFLIKIGLPLPFGKILNSRSLVSIDNLIDLLVTVIDHPAAIDNIFFVSDNDDVSTTQLIKKLSLLMKRNIILLPIPTWILKLVLHFFRQSKIADRLILSLHVDIEKTTKLLGWKPPLTLEDGLKKMLEKQ